MTESNASTYYEELAALNKAAEVKPRILVCAPSNAGIDNVIMKIMGDRFVDGHVSLALFIDSLSSIIFRDSLFSILSIQNGQGAKYSPSIVRVGAGITNPKITSIGLKEQVDSIITQGSDVSKLENIIVTGRQTLKRFQNEIHKLRIRIQAMVECCPYEIATVMCVMRLRGLFRQSLWARGGTRKHFGWKHRRELSRDELRVRWRRRRRGWLIFWWTKNKTTLSRLEDFLVMADMDMMDADGRPGDD